MKKRVLSIILATVMVAGCIGLTACGSDKTSNGSAAQEQTADKDAAKDSDEELIKAAFDDAFNSVFNAEAVQSTIESSLLGDAEESEVGSLDYTKLIDAIMKKVSYELTDIKVDGDKATAVATVYYMGDTEDSSDEMNDELTNALTEKLEEGSLEDFSMADYYQLAIDFMADYIEGHEFGQESSSVDATFIKTDGKWTLEDESVLDTSLVDIQ